VRAVSADLLKEARRAAKRGDHSRAGDLYDLAGHPHEAIEMYVQGRHYVLAGQVAARIGEHTTAAGYFASSNDFVQAAEMYLKAGQTKKASLMYERGGQYLKALARISRFFRDPAFRQSLDENVKLLASVELGKYGSFLTAVSTLLFSLLPMVFRPARLKGSIHKYGDRLQLLATKIFGRMGRTPHI